MSNFEGIDETQRLHLDGLLRVAAVHERLTHAGDEEHLVVHGEAEQHGHQKDRHEAQDGPRHDPKRAGSQDYR